MTTERTKKLLEVIEKLGPISRRDAEIAAGFELGSAGKIVTNLTRDLSRTPKRVYISGWAPSVGEFLTRQAPLYSIGNLPDAKSPFDGKKSKKHKMTEKKEKPLAPGIALQLIWHNVVRC